MTHEQKGQYNDPRFKRELECEIHIATGCRVALYAEERPTGLDQCSTYDHWVGHWSTPNWQHPVTRFVSVEEMERAVAEAEARGKADGHAEALMEFARRDELAAIHDAGKGIKGEPYWRIYMQAVFEDPSKATEDEALECVETIIREFKRIGAEEERARCLEAVRQHGISPFPIDDPHPTAEAINATLQNVTAAIRKGEQP